MKHIDSDTPLMCPECEKIVLVFECGFYQTVEDGKKKTFFICPHCGEELTADDAVE